MLGKFHQHVDELPSGAFLLLPKNRWIRKVLLGVPPILNNPPRSSVGQRKARSYRGARAPLSGMVNGGGPSGWGEPTMAQRRGKGNARTKTTRARALALFARDGLTGGGCLHPLQRSESRRALMRRLKICRHRDPRPWENESAGQRKLTSVLRGGLRPSAGVPPPGPAGSLNAEQREEKRKCVRVSPCA